MKLHCVALLVHDGKLESDDFPLINLTNEEAKLIYTQNAQATENKYSATVMENAFDKRIAMDHLLALSNWVQAHRDKGYFIGWRIGK